MKMSILIGSALLVWTGSQGALASSEAISNANISEAGSVAVEQNTPQGEDRPSDAQDPSLFMLPPGHGGGHGGGGGGHGGGGHGGGGGWPGGGGHGGGGGWPGGGGHGGGGGWPGGGGHGGGGGWPGGGGHGGGGGWPGGGGHGYGGWNPRPGWHSGWRWSYNRYPYWWRRGIRFPGFVWIGVGAPRGYWQCTAFDANLNAYSETGPDLHSAAYNAMYECGASNFSSSACYIPRGYCKRIW